MDEIVKAAMAKWPHVPDCRGWLGLDARGDWYLRDDACQAAGPFPQAKGSRLRHDKLIGFIHRNYAPDAQGAWYFQNGPQRVYAALEAAPLVLRLHDDGTVVDHTGESLAPREAVLDEAGWLYLDTPKGLGLVHSLDMALAAERLEGSAWPLVEVASADLPARYGFVRQP